MTSVMEFMKSELNRCGSDSRVMLERCKSDGDADAGWGYPMRWVAAAGSDAKVHDAPKEVISGCCNGDDSKTKIEIKKAQGMSEMPVSYKW